MLFNIRPLKSTDEVRNEIRKIVARQKKGSDDDLTAFGGEIEELLSLLLGEAGSGQELLRAFWQEEWGQADLDERWERGLHDGVIEDLGKQ